MTNYGFQREEKMTDDKAESTLDRARTLSQLTEAVFEVGESSRFRQITDINLFARRFAVG